MPPLPQPRRLLRGVPLLVFLVACGGQAAGQGLHGLGVEVLGRQAAPGEPLRVLVTSAAPLERLTARFLDQSIFFVKTASGAQPETWSGWTMVALDETRGSAAVEVQGVTHDGSHVAGTLAVRIHPREFPRENLSVESHYVEPPPEVTARLARERKELSGIYASRRAVQPVEPFLRPVPGDPTSAFGTRRLFNGKPRSPHPGLDLRAPSGTPVLASGPGSVVLAEDLYYAGNTVIVDHGGGLFTLYAHLSRFSVDEGDDVHAGRQVGLSGATGRVTGPHLHWGAKIGDRPFDPRALLDDALFVRGRGSSARRPGFSLPESVKRSIYSRVRESFSTGVLLLPDDASAAGLELDLAPLLILEGAVEMEGAPVEVRFTRSEVTVSGRSLQQIAYVWRLTRGGPDDDPAEQGIRVTLAADGSPVIWEVLRDSSGARIVFVAAEIEDAAHQRFGAPLPGRRASVARGLDQAPALVVPRAIESGPMPLGPFVYLNEDQRDVAALICRCMPSQIDEIQATGSYALQPLRGTNDPFRSPADLERILRLPPDAF